MKKRFYFYLPFGLICGKNNNTSNKNHDTNTEQEKKLYFEYDKKPITIIIRSEQEFLAELKSKNQELFSYSQKISDQIEENNNSIQELKRQKKQKKEERTKLREEIKKISETESALSKLIRENDILLLEIKLAEVNIKPLAKFNINLGQNSCKNQENLQEFFINNQKIKQCETKKKNLIELCNALLERKTNFPHIEKERKELNFLKIQKQNKIPEIQKLIEEYQLKIENLEDSVESNWSIIADIEISMKENLVKMQAIESNQYNQIIEKI